MASLALQPETVSLFGGKKPKNPERHRFYACELKWNAWNCRPTEEKIWKPANDTLATQLIPVGSWVPKFFDPLILSYSLRKPVFIKKD
jgi:hypothetical protein